MIFRRVLLFSRKGGGKVTVLIFAATYIFLSALTAAILRKLHKSGKCLPSLSPAAFLILSFSWGLPVTLVGCVAALTVRAKGEKPTKHKLVYCFEGERDFGISLGIFIFVPKNSNNAIKDHELGHSVQNALIGIFAVSAVFVPSAVRYQIREMRRGKCRTGYDCVWFEGQATRTGTNVRVPKREVDNGGKDGYNESR